MTEQKIAPDRLGAFSDAVIAMVIAIGITLKTS